MTRPQLNALNTDGMILDVPYEDVKQIDAADQEVSLPMAQV